MGVTVGLAEVVSPLPQASFEFQAFVLDQPAAMLIVEA